MSASGAQQTHAGRFRRVPLRARARPHRVPARPAANEPLRITVHPRYPQPVNPGAQP